MLDRIAIIGLGPIGLSMGLALKRAGLTQTEVVGSSGDREALSAASRLGAVDRATGSLGAALEGAGLVVLDAPVSEMEPLLEAIGPVLEDGCTVTDTGPAKVRVMRWAGRHLRDGRYFVGGHPVPNRAARTAEAAEAGLFDGGYYGIVTTEATDPGAVATVVGMVEMLGARPLFMDAEEHDSYAAALEQLPLVMSFALAGAAAGAPAWRDMSRLAGPEFEGATELASTDPELGAEAARANGEALSRWIDRLVSELTSYRELLDGDGDGLADAFIGAWEARARWRAGPAADEEGSDAPSAAQTMAGLVVGRRLAERYRKLTASGRRPSWEYTKKQG